MKAIYSADTAYTLRNFSDLYKTLAKKKHHFYLKHSIMAGLLLLGAAVSYFKWEYQDVAVMFLGCAVLYPWFVYTLQRSQIRRQWRNAERKWSRESRIDFYDDYLEQVSDNHQARFGYYEIREILESRTHFHFMISEKHAISLEKAACSEGLQKFIKRIKTEGK